MFHDADLIHYGTIAFSVGINSIGVGLGQGLTSKAALDAINQQPGARSAITRTTILGMALIETAAIMGCFIAIVLLKGGNQPIPSYHNNLAELGIALAICIPGFVLGLVSALPAQAACMAIARQPFFSGPILRFMLITQSLIQTPIIFGLIIALFIKGQATQAQTIGDSLRLIGSGLCIGLGSVGPAIGLALFANNACTSLGINPKAYNKVLSFTLLSGAIIETPIIFSLLISLALLIIVGPMHTEDITRGIALLGAAFCTSLGTIGPGISSGRLAAAACRQIALSPDLNNTLVSTSLFAHGLIEACTIYSVLISALLIFLY